MSIDNELDFLREQDAKATEALLRARGKAGELPDPSRAVRPFTAPLAGRWERVSEEERDE